MKVRNIKITFLDYLKSNPYSQLLTPISTIFGFSDILKAFLLKGYPPVVSIGAATGVGLVLLYNFHRLRPVHLKGPASSLEFYPFLAPLDNASRARFVIARPRDLQLISDAINRNTRVYSIISGESGAGKTTLLQVYAATSTKETFIHIVDAHVNGFYDLLTSTLSFLDSPRNTDLETILDDILAAIKLKGLRRESLSDHFNMLVDYLRNNLSNDRLVLIFEQSERLSVNVRHFGKEEFQATLAFFEALRTSEWIRVGFVTRNDRATDVLTLLPRQSFDVVFIDSLEIDDQSISTLDMRRRFQIVCSSDECDKIIEIATKNNVHNTFVLALAGYIVEATGADTIIDSNTRGYDGIHQIIAIYLRLLSDEYAYMKKDASAKADLEMVLYALALYNHRTNLACTADRIARICHLPKDRVEDVIFHLLERHLVAPDRQSYEDLRLAHDLLSEHVMRRDENEYLRIDHALSMQHIVDRQLAPADLIDVQPEKDPFISTFIDGRWPSTAAFLLWIAAVFYGLRLADPALVMSWLGPVNSLLDRYLPGVVSPFGFDAWYFLPIAFTQYVWVLFMYGLDRGFFRYVTVAEGRPVMGWILHLVGPLGAALGLTLSFAPSLFIIPIVVPALILAACYLILWRKHTGGRLIGDYFFSLGATTIGNMVIAMLVCMGLTELLLLRVGGDKDIVGFVNLLLVCASFWYFAYVMYGLQGSLHGRAALLTIYDSGRRR
jgi:hypothetical protein